MRTVFHPLFEVRLRHSFYLSGSSISDFVVEPSPATRRALKGGGLVFRRLADGWAVYGEIEPDSSPRRLLRPLGTAGLRLTFLLLPANPHLWNISDLEGYRPGSAVFYFNNLFDDAQLGRLHLGDSVADARVGTPLPLIAGNDLTHPFGAPVQAAAVTVTDLFGRTVATSSFSLPDPAAETSEHRLDLAAAGLAAGRYTATDDHGGSRAFYYDPEIFAGRPFGVVEIFSRTDGLTADESERVPAAYRFLDGDEVTGNGAYALQLESRSTRWRFNVIKKYTTNGFQLADLGVTGAVPFDKAVEADRAIFTSTDSVPLRDSRQPLALEENNDKVRDLPNPGATTPLAAGAAPGSYVSEMYVYI